ncbi:MAG: caspase family protein [Flavobacteriaceae bacterium]|nr:caspase family protein [Flavobacteriaceae bacterium]
MKTLALIIGNNEYHESAKLDNAINDAKSIDNIFTKLGFDTITQFDCKNADYANLLNEFDKNISNYDASIFYYAGHGFELEGENYLPSIESQIPPTDKYNAGRNSIRLNEILEIHKKHNKKINIVIIDACRKTFDRGISGLAPILAPKGSLIAFSTSPGKGAKDEGYENNSIYTGSIIKHLGKERLTIEELFKKVRKTVYALSNETQITWEHTSLISDFYFNKISEKGLNELPYEKEVIKDVYYDENKDEFSKIIKDLRSNNWHKQNPAVTKILDIEPNSLDRNQQFIFGRNLLQSSCCANNSIDFMDNLQSNISRYNISNENHVLNGILFEIYFNSYGEFRGQKRKNHHIEKILELRNFKSYSKSFEFIRELLLKKDYDLIYIPDDQNTLIDIDVQAIQKNIPNYKGEIITYQAISVISYKGIDITDMISTYDILGLNELGLKNCIANFLTAPLDLIKINCNIQLSKITFLKMLNEISEW